MSAARQQPTDASLEQKIRPRGWLAQAVRRFQRDGYRVVLTNGCFDVLHVGHVMLLARAKRLGDILIVALNSDRSVRTLKGPRRPIILQRDRARLVAALASVDYVTMFDEPTPLQLIQALKPNVLVKGADWKASGIVGRALVHRYGGRVVCLPLVSGYSTTQLITRILRQSRR